MRRTKIVATLGPATDDEDSLRALLQAGVNVVRINFSHGSAEDHKNRVDSVRRIAAEEGFIIGILGDLQGPKIRVSDFVDGSIELEEGDSFTLDVNLDPKAGNKQVVGCTYKALPDDISVGSVLVLDDGRICLLYTSPSPRD